MQFTQFLNISLMVNMVIVKSVLLVWSSRLATMFTSFALIPILHNDLTQEAFVTALFFQAIYGWGQLTDLGTSTRNRNLIHSKLKVKYVISSVTTLFLILIGGALLISAFFYFFKINYLFQSFLYLSIILFAGYSEHLVRLLYSKGVRNATSVVGLISCVFILLYSYFYDFSSVLEFLAVFYLPSASIRFLLFCSHFKWNVFYFSYRKLIHNIIKSRTYFFVNLLGVVAYYSFPVIAEIFVSKAFRFFSILYSTTFLTHASFPYSGGHWSDQLPLIITNLITYY